jgi:DNA helicase-2/ATP-dependent DNA helicase PcrA
VIPESGPRYTPAELARLLRLGHLPTREQEAVIAAPVAPLLVVAGAGSGKTETMAARVVWLVANDYVRPEQVLGLTFTRKAAGELAHRVRTRLAQLQRRLGGDDLAGEPTVATYHSFAARILTEHGIRGGFEPTARLLTEASRWQVVDALVRAYAGDMSGVTGQPSTVTDRVLALAGELAEHLMTPGPTRPDVRRGPRPAGAPAPAAAPAAAHPRVRAAQARRRGDRLRRPAQPRGPDRP